MELGERLKPDSCPKQNGVQSFPDDVCWEQGQFGCGIGNTEAELPKIMKECRPHTGAQSAGYPQGQAVRLGNPMKKENELSEQAKMAGPIQSVANLATCHLLERLRQDLQSSIDSLSLANREEVGAVLQDLVSRYSKEECSERPAFDQLLRAHRDLKSAMDRKEQFLAHILKESADAIITVDRQQKVVIWNKGAETIFGFTEEEIIGKPLQKLVSPARQDELRQIRHHTRRFGAVNNRLTQWVTRAGRSIQIILTSTAVRDRSGRYTGSSFVIKDVTRQREMEEAVRQAEHIASIGRLAAGLAHEIKNPLAGIQGAIEVIRDRSDGVFEKEVLSDVLVEVARIDKIVCDLMQYARPKKPQLKPLLLEPIAWRIIQLLQKSAGRNVEFQVEGRPEDREVLVIGDEGHLEQVMMNLLLNAVEASEGNGEIKVIFRADPEMVSVRVRDFGPGVPIGIQSKIFHPFFTTKRTGTGLGLATCRRIVHEIGGSLFLEPVSGPGAAFVLKLPRGDRE